jgi:hypothetical protein
MSPKGRKGLPEGGFVGIDPGKSGGVGYVHDSGFSAAWKMPDTTLDIYELLSFVIRPSTMVCLERVASRPGQGAPSVFNFGVSYGELRMAVVSLRTRYELVTPQTWQKSLKCLSGGDKNVTKSKAQQLWPHLQITHAIADALLIAEYGRRFQI